MTVNVLVSPQTDKGSKFPAKQLSFLTMKISLDISPNMKGAQHHL